MKVNWKYFAQTSGYKSLKAAVNRDKMQNPNDKARYEQFFREIINHICYVASQLNKPPWEILDELESIRDYWYPNFYQSGRYLSHYGVRVNKQRLHPSTVRGAIRAYKYGKGLWSRRYHDRRRQKAVIMDIQRRYKSL